MKNSVTKTLISFSITLLLALQFLWLTSSYEKAYFDLRRNTNIIFRNTVYQLRDTLFVNTLQPKIDSMHQFEKDPINRFESIAIRRLPNDSISLLRSTSNVQVYISSTGTNDSLLKSLQPLTNRIQSLRNARQSFTIRIAPDSLNIDSLTFYFKKNLVTLSPLVNPTVQQIQTEDGGFQFQALRGALPMHWQPDQREYDRPRIFLRDSLLLESVRLNPTKRYQASLVGVRGIILKDIMPQILFSLFLTLTISTAFLFMYRNIRSQQKLMEQKSNFISNITHELKTPVATVSVALEALQNFDVNTNAQKSKEYLSIAQQELSRLTAITDSILRTSLFEEGATAIQTPRIDLNTLLNNALNSLKLLIEKSGAEMNTQTDGKNFMIKGNTLHLTNVISNLIENALKYSHYKPKIEISLRENDQSVSLHVKDKGIGIAKEYQHKVFEKFFRVPTGDIHNIKGYGLGLSYVDSVVKAHGAAISLNSEPGEGSEFIITFPKA